MTEAEKSVKCGGLQFAIPPKTLDYANYMVSFEVLFRNIKTSILNTLENEPIKLKLLDTAFSLFDAIKKNKTKSNLSETELGALNYLI